MWAEAELLLRTNSFSGPALILPRRTDHKEPDDVLDDRPNEAEEDRIDHQQNPPLFFVLSNESK